MPAIPQPTPEEDPNSTVPDKPVSKICPVGQKTCHSVLTDHDMF